MDSTPAEGKKKKGVPPLRRRTESRSGNGVHRFRRGEDGLRCDDIRRVGCLTVLWEGRETSQQAGGDRSSQKILFVKIIIGR